MINKFIEDGWILTDPDTNQYGKKISNKIFEFKQSDINDNYPVTIDLNDYTYEQIENCINSYGYTIFNAGMGMLNIDKEYGDDADWIIAECLFEMEM